jgi:hypothetical protein
MRFAMGNSYLRTLMDKEIWILVRTVIILFSGLVFLTHCSRGGTQTYGVSVIVTSSGVGVQGVIMTLSGAGTDTMSTDASGKFAFSGLMNGYYTVAPEKSGYTFIPASSIQSVNGAYVTDANFTAAVSMANTYSVSGTVTSSGAGLPGVIVILSGEGSGTMLTDTNGKYTFISLAVGNYTITPAKFGYIFTPTSSVQNVIGTDISNVNFTGSIATTNSSLCSDFSTVLVTTGSLGSASTFSTGTPITLQMQVTNISDQDQTLTEEFNCGGLPFTVVDVSGKSVYINPDPRLACPTMLSPYHFAPGQTQTLSAVWNQTTNNGAQVPAGRYSVTATLPTTECNSATGNSLSQSADFQIQ